MWRGNDWRQFFARPQAAAVLYVSLGAQTLHAALYAQGAWQTQCAVDIAGETVDVAQPHAALALLLDAVQHLQDQVLAGLSQDANAIGPLDVQASISTRWLASETLAWSDAAGATGLLALATQHLQQSGFLLEAHDVVRWEDAPWGSPRWVVAYPATLMQALQRLAGALGGRLVSVLPAASLVAQLLKNTGNGLALVGHVESGMFHLLEVHDGCVQATMQRSLDEDGSSNAQGVPLTEQLSRLWQGMQLRTAHWHDLGRLAVVSEEEAFNLTEKAEFEVLPWPQPEQRQLAPMLRTLHTLRTANGVGNALDAVGQQVSVSLRSVFLLTCAVVMVLALMWVFGLNVQTIHKLESARQVLAASVVHSGPIALSKAQQDQVVAINAAIRQLNMPVEELLRALRPPRDIHVALLGVDLSDSGTEGELPKLKLTAEAISGEDMTLYMGFLHGRRPLVQASLVRHEVLTSVSASPWRFTMELTWRP